MSGPGFGFEDAPAGGLPGLEEEAAHLLDDLDASQRLAVTTPAAPLCIRAGPGSGKTRVLTRRIAYRIATGDCEPRFTVAVTFTRRAAAELQERLEALGIRERVVVGTFHGLAARQLRRHADDDGRTAPEILSNRAGVLASLLRPGESAQAVQRELDWYGASGVDPAGYPAAVAAEGRRAPLPPERLADIMARYTGTKRRLNLVDFGDLLQLAAERLERDAATAEAWRWGHRHFFVDELQDLTPAQFRLLRAWLGDRSDLCAVGDADQAIFGWNGADRRMLGDFSALFAGGSVVDLGANYRCSPRIVTMAGVLRDGGAAAPAVARGVDADVSPFAEPVPPVVEYPSAAAEAAGVAGAVRSGRAPGESWSAQAILVRTRRQVSEMVEALQAAGVPAHAADPDAETTGSADDAVCVSTMHAAKGLEWSVVHVAGLEEGLVPIRGANRGEAFEEERRLLYVALTRARRRLHLSWAAQRSVGDRPERRRPSRWLAALSEVAGSGGGEGPRHRGARPAGQRPPDLHAPTDPLVVALEAWRKQVARVARVAPAAILSDRDLAAVAENRPATTAELGVVTGLGASRLDRWGPQLLDLVAGHSPAADRPNP